MTLYNYDYIIADAVASGKVDNSRLQQEIQAADITIALDHITQADGKVSVFFKAMLSDEEMLVLDQIIHDHSGEPLLEGPQEVKLVGSDIVMPSKQTGPVDMTGMNAYRKGYSYIIRAGTTAVFETKYDANIALQGLSLRFSAGVHEGTVELDAHADAANQGTGQIRQAVNSESSHNTRKYDFTVSSVGSSTVIDWNSDADTSGSITFTSAETIDFEDGIVLEVDDPSNYVVGDKFTLIIDRGDYIELELVDVDGVLGYPGLVLAKFGETIYPTKNWILNAIYPDCKKLYSWVYIRVRYVSSSYAVENTLIKFDHVMRMITK